MIWISEFLCPWCSNEAKLIEEIVQCVMWKLNDVYGSEVHLKGLIEIHEKIANVESLFCKGSSEHVRMIGIWVMGGVGKTTLARVIYDKLHSHYEGCCFLATVREESKIYGIAVVKEKLIWPLLGNKESRIGMPNEISPYICHEETWSEK